MLLRTHSQEECYSFGFLSAINSLRYKNVNFTLKRFRAIFCLKRRSSMSTELSYVLVHSGCCTFFSSN